MVPVGDCDLLLTISVDASCASAERLSQPDWLPSLMHAASCVAVVAYAPALVTGLLRPSNRGFVSSAQHARLLPVAGFSAQRSHHTHTRRPPTLTTHHSPLTSCDHFAAGSMLATACVRPTGQLPAPSPRRPGCSGRRPMAPRPRHTRPPFPI